MNKIQQISMSLSNHQPRIIEPGWRAHAAVTMILEEQSDGLRILFIKRSTNKNDYWSGQIGFPGGRVESFDRGLKETAERETREEIGLDLSTAQYLGRLSDIAPGGLQIVISCFVYVVNQHPVLSPDNREIADVFWIPVRELLNPARCSQVEFTFLNRQRKFPSVRVDDNEPPLWGITYRLLRDFNKIIYRTINQDCYK